MGTINIKDAIQQLKEQGMFPSIVRYRKDYDMAQSQELVTEIGRQRTENFSIDSDNIFCYENFIKWLHGDTTMLALDPMTRLTIRGDLTKGIYIAGGTGTGKSWCMEIMRAYAHLVGLKISFGDEKIFLNWRISRATSVVDKFIETTSIEEYKTCRVLCIQDLGSEPLESLAMGNRSNVMRSLLEYRGDRSDLLTLVTSNIALCNPLLVQFYDTRVASRLQGMCNYFELRGKDRRKLK